MKKFWLILIVAVILVAGAGLWAWRSVNAPFAGISPVWVYVPRETGREALADTLRNRLGEQVADRVMTVFNAVAKDSTDAHGAYLIYPGERAKVAGRDRYRRRRAAEELTFNAIR